jgi:protein involved in polysaccharide export with SLBB domain
MTPARHRVGLWRLAGIAWFLSIAFLSSGAAAPAQAQPAYRLEVGDVVELSVVWAPELQRRAAV